MNGQARLDKLIAWSELTVELNKVATNPILGESRDGELLEHYRCQLLRPGKHLNVYLSVHAEEGSPTLFDVLFMLALDASGCDMMAGFDIYREKWNTIFGDSGSQAKEIEVFWEELDSRCKQTEKFIDFLGPAAFEELLSLFGLEDGENLNPLVPLHQYSSTE